VAEGAVDLGIPGLGLATPVGRGGFGTVYRAEQAAFGRTVAVKVLSGTLDDRVQRRFERECQAMGSLSDHPGIVTIFDAGTTATGAPYLVMAFQPGGSMADRLAREGPLGWPTAVRVGVEVASALAAAHRIEILHRDVKPANILLSGYGTAQLGDFGIARITGATQTHSDHITASILYAAPEILDGKTPATAADVYSLAVTLFEIITGEPAFVGEPGESLGALIVRLATAPPPDLRPQGVPDDVAAILEAALAKSPDDRPESAAALARLLADAGRRHGVELGTVAAPAAPEPRLAETVAAPEAAAAWAGSTSTLSFVPTHAAPERGLPAWSTPDPTYPAVATLDPWLPVQVLRWWGEWAHIRCANGWEAWVNGRLLVS
jgi:serine/threonine-protein kinase PknK